MFIKIPIRFFIKAMANGDKKFIKKHKTFGNFHLYKDLAYIDDGDEYHLLDIYSPVLNHENNVTLFYVHGGAYVYGHKDYQRVFCSWFVNEGFKVITPNYPLLNNEKNVDVKTQVQDLFKALEFIEEFHLLYNVNLNNFCLMGDSAGGHLCLLIDLIYHNKDIQEFFEIKKLPNINIKCVALNSSMYDYPSLRKLGEDVLRKKDVLKLFSSYCYEDNYMRDLSPRYYINKGAKLSPLFASSSFHDYFLDQTLRLKKDAKDLNLDAEILIETSPNKKIAHVYNHFIFENEGYKCNKAMVDFFLKWCND